MRGTTREPMGEDTYSVPTHLSNRWEGTKRVRVLWRVDTGIKVGTDQVRSGVDGVESTRRSGSYRFFVETG